MLHPRHDGEQSFTDGKFLTHPWTSTSMTRYHVANQHGTHLALDAPTPIITTVSSFIAISWYNALAINVVIFLVFKRWGGLYFYSLLIASWGIVLHQLGYLLQFFGLVDTFAKHYVVMMVGWYAMVGVTFGGEVEPWTTITDRFVDHRSSCCAIFSTPPYCTRPEEVQLGPLHDRLQCDLIPCPYDDTTSYGRTFILVLV